MSALTLLGILLLLGFAVFGLLVFLQLRSDRRRLAEIRAKLQRKAEAGINPFDDGFYCIMLSDGTCRSGYVTAPQEQACDARKPE